MQHKKIDYSKDIIDIISRENKRPIPVGIILKKLSKKIEHINRNVFFNNIQLLKNTCQVKVLRSGKLVLGYPKAEVDMSNIYKGSIAINSTFAGFITLEGEEESKFYVHKTNLGGALDGDVVEFALLKMPEDPSKTLKDAKVLRIIEHKKGYYVGLYKSDGFGYQVVTDNKKMYLPVKLDDTTGLTNGTKILFRVNQFTEKEALCSVVKNIGHISDVGTDILSIVYDFGSEPEFPQEVLDYANKLSVTLDEKQKKIRKNLTDLDIVTIDPKESKDFDDAIYTKKINDHEFKLFVCIADVSHYVVKDTPLDKEALKRGCSIYLVDRVIPMLPHILSDDICSLNPNLVRLSITCEMIIDDKGDFKDIKVYPSIMKSHRRFSYDEVNDYFYNKNKLENDTDSIKQMLSDSLELHKILTKMKYQRGYIELEVPEPKIIVNEKCEPIEIKLRESGEAQKMIEDFMVAANEAVTIFAESKGWPFVYRTHDLPKNQRIETFRVEAKKLNFKLPSGDLEITPKEFSRWMDANKDNPNIDLISILMLRTMAKAKYTIENIGHFGLASKNYTHFTSPIRRYPDLLVHRIYWMWLFDKESYTDYQRAQIIELLKDYCKQSNEGELRAIETERAVNSLKFAQYMKNHIGEEFDGKVSGVTKFGVFVELPNTIEGMIRLVNLKDDFYVYDEKNFQLIGKQTNKIFTLGTKVKVKCIGANIAERAIDFELVSRI